MNALRSCVVAAALCGICAPASGQVIPSDVAGAYLAGRAAGSANDFGAASDWYLAALADDPSDPGIIDSCLLALVSLGDFARAQSVAVIARDNGHQSQLAEMVLLTSAAQAGAWSDLRGQLSGPGISPRINQIAAAWSLIGEGRVEDALAAFDAAATETNEGYARYHKAMALASVGETVQAEEMFATQVPRTRRSVVAHAQLLSGLDRFDEAQSLLDASFGPNKDPAILALSRALENAQQVPFRIVTSAQEGIAEIFHTEAASFVANSPAEIVLLYSQVARALHPDDAEMTMMSAGLLEDLGRYAQAGQTFATINAQSPVFHSAEFGRANVLFEAGEPEAAIGVLENIVAGYPQLAMAHAELGDIHRSMRNMDAANLAYTAALDLVPASDRRHWVLRYKRGITFHQIDQWDAAEADFRMALTQNPDHAGLLNYLGYSLVERGEHLEEALDMIVRAVASEPENGAIIDSYAWALYSLGQFDEAVEPMERAAQLLPEDPVINDHLGDIYYAVGRELEAEFQWRRALSYVTDEETAAVLRQKLENGLEIAMTESEGDAVDAAQDL